MERVNVVNYFILLVKGYLRKATNLMAMKDLTRASEVYQKAIDIDPQCQVRSHMNYSYMYF